jgi:hypothetical protein
VTHLTLCMKIPFSITPTLKLGEACVSVTLAAQHTAPSTKQLDEHLSVFVSSSVCFLTAFFGIQKKTCSWSRDKPFSGVTVISLGAVGSRKRGWLPDRGMIFLCSPNCPDRFCGPPRCLFQG